MEIKLNLKFIKLKDPFNAFFVTKFPVIRKIEVVPKEVFFHDMGFFFSCERAFRCGDISAQSVALKVDELQTSFRPAGLGQPFRIKEGGRGGVSASRSGQNS